MPRKTLMRGHFNRKQFQAIGAKPPRKKPVPWEHMEQCKLINWVRGMEAFFPELALLHSSFNPGKLSKIQAAKMKREGAKAGFPDLHLPIKTIDYASLYIEMKRKTGGSLSEEQRRVLPMLEANGNKVVVCRSWQHAANEIGAYLDINKKYLPHIPKG